MTHLKTFLVDDLRDIKADSVARTYADAVRIAEQLDLSKAVLYLDHDLGEVKTGYDFISYLIAEDNLPKEVLIVSSNPVGRDNIGRALVQEGFIRKSPQKFLKPKV